MQYLFQSVNFRGVAAKPYRDLIRGTVTDPLDKAGSGGAMPLEIALDQGNIHHYLVGARLGAGRRPAGS